MRCEDLVPKREPRNGIVGMDLRTKGLLGPAVIARRRAVWVKPKVVLLMVKKVRSTDENDGMRMSFYVEMSRGDLWNIECLIE